MEIILAILITTLSSLGGVFLGSWITWRALRNDRLISETTKDDIPKPEEELEHPSIEMSEAIKETQQFTQAQQLDNSLD